MAASIHSHPLMGRTSRSNQSTSDLAITPEWLNNNQQIFWPSSLVTKVCIVGLSVCILSLIGDVLYNLYFHPLANFPGPWLARSSLIWRIWNSTRGQFHLRVAEGHQKYGSVLRVSPNELAFATKESWKEIYGYKSNTPGRETCRKGPLYEMFAAGYKTNCIASEQDPQKHSAMKKQLSPIMSNKAIMEQEIIIRECVDSFVAKMATNAAVEDTGVNMSLCQVWQTTFLARHHPQPFVPRDGDGQYPPDSFCFELRQNITAMYSTEMRDRHLNFTRKRLEQRLQNDSGRKDFLTHIIGHVKDSSMSKDQMLSHVSTLVVAGGETVAVSLTATTYFLLKTPDAYHKVMQEIRMAYSSYDEITASSAQKLPYLQAVLHETWRMHAPGSFNLPRISPGAFIDGNWVPKGAEISTSGWTITHSDRYWKDPYTFRPERWLNPSEEDDLKASQPFLLGPRECLGKNFALVEISLLLACLFFEYDMELINPAFDWQANARIHVLWWKPELMVRMIPRGEKSIALRKELVM